MDFQIPDDLRDPRERTRRFTADEVPPLEREASCDAHGFADELPIPHRLSRRCTAPG